MSIITNNDSWSADKTLIFGGKSTIFRTKVSGGNYQFQCWISNEKKYIRKSLKTSDKETAIQRAENLYLEIYSDITSGKKLFGITLQELVDSYLSFRKNHVEKGFITHGRYITIKSQLNHFLKYKGNKTKLSEMDRKSVFDYHNFRLQKKAKDITVRNEQPTINAMMKWASENGLSSLSKFEFDIIRIREVGRRDTFTPKEYDDNAGSLDLKTHISLLLFKK